MTLRAERYSRGPRPWQGGMAVCGHGPNKMSHERKNVCAWSCTFECVTVYDMAAPSVLSAQLPQKTDVQTKIRGSFACEYFGIR